MGLEYNTKKLLLLHPSMVRCQVACDRARAAKRKKEEEEGVEDKDDDDITSKINKYSTFTQRL
jgi:hypothetical protein